MPLNIPSDTPTSFPTLQYLTLDNFKRGVITLIDESRLPKNALKEADNIFLVEDGQPSLRPGVDWFGTAMPNVSEIHGFDYFDFAGVIHLVATAGGNIYRSTDDGTTWDLCSGATLTDGVKTNMLQNNNYLYITNGVDNMVRYDGSTTLQVYTSLSTPSAPSVAETGLAGTANQYYYKVSAVNQVGFTAASSATAAVQATLARQSWDTSTNYATLSIGAVTGATRYDVYISEDTTYYYYLGSATPSSPGGAATFIDDGSAIVNPSTTAPTDNTTTGPKVEELTNVGSRMYGVRDTANRYRIWFTGTGQAAGAFSTAYDGGYLDWSPGGKYIPVYKIARHAEVNIA